MTTSSRVRLTRRGVILAGIGALAAVGSVLTGAPAFTVVGLAALVAVVLAVALAHRGRATHLERLTVPSLVERGRVIEVPLSAAAASATPSITVIDRLAGEQVTIVLPPAVAGTQTMMRYRVRPLRRGVQVLGPLTEIRRDPFSLATRAITHPLTAQIVVHPMVHVLRTPPRHRTRAPELRLTAVGDPNAEFRSLRDYVPGDDVRQVHWPSSARNNTLVVRDRETTRPPSRTVIVDTAERSATEALFEDALEVAASLVCSWLALDTPVAIRTTDRRAPGWPSQLRNRTEALTLLARVSRTDEQHTRSVADVLAGDSGDRLVVVAGAASTFVGRLLTAPSAARRLTVVRLVDGSAPVSPLPVPSIDVANAEQFAAAWSAGLVSL